MIIDEEDYLAHFGVKGMKWGVRNEDKRTVRREAKAQKFVTKANVAQDQIDAIRNGPRRTNTFKNRRIRKLEAEKAQALEDAEAKRQGKLTDRQKKIAIGAAAVGTIVAARVTYNLAQKGEFRRLGAKGKELLTGKEFRFKENPVLAYDHLDADQLHKIVVDGINPDYGALGTKMNCRRCTFAYEMRRRGFDVQATRTSNASGGTPGGLLNAISPGEELRPTSKLATILQAGRDTAKKQANPDAVTPVLDILQAGGGRKAIPGTHPLIILETLAREPDGSRGELGVIWQGGGGHSLAYEIVKGAPVIFDTQNGRKYDEDNFIGALPGVASAAFTRLDNIPLNNDQLLRWVRNAD